MLNPFSEGDGRPFSPDLKIVAKIYTYTESHIVQPQYQLNRNVIVIRCGINVPNFGDNRHPKTVVELARDAEEAGWES